MQSTRQYPDDHSQLIKQQAPDIMMTLSLRERTSD
jgi:hypothetical protein